MLSATMKYGAVRAKVMALYGKMLGEEKTNKLCSCSNLAELAAVLRTCPEWSSNPALSGYAPNAEKLKNMVESSLISDYISLWHFCSVEDKIFLSFILRRLEMNAILLKLRSFRGSVKPMNPDIEGLLRRKGSLNPDDLEQCVNYHELISAAGKTVYAASLEALRPQKGTELPDYRMVSMALENECFRHLFSYVGKNTEGRNRILLTELIGTEADLMNLVNILRIIKYFPASAAEGTKLLIPVYNKLKPQLAEKLMTAKSCEEAISMLSGTSLGRMASGLDLSKPERVYTVCLAALCHRLLMLPEPSVCTAQAYLTLKELECGRLIRIIDAINCGADPRSAI